MASLGYNTITTGEVSGSTSAKQLPDVDADSINIRAASTNAGNVYLGGSGVTVLDGTTDTTTGLELDAGQETGWISVPNLSLFYIICNNAGDDIVYMALTTA